MKRLFIIIFSILVSWTSVFAQDNKFVVVIDPGHGGRDTGAVRGSIKEKDINLGVAQLLGAMIEENHKDVEVVYTRKKDIFVDLNRRADIANKAKANLFISIHTNSTAAKSTNVSGADTYILGLARSEESLEVAKRENSVILLEDDYKKKYEGFDPKKPESYIIFEYISNKYLEQSLQFADFVQKNFKSVAKRTDRGVRQAGFLVLRRTSMPSVLIELGFINNSSEASYLSSRLGQRSMATAVYSGFEKYKREFDKKQVSSYVAVNTANTEVENVSEDKTRRSIPVVRVKNEDIKPVERATSTGKITAGEQKNNETVVQEKPIEKPVIKTQEKKEEPKKDYGNQIEYRVQFLISQKVLPANSSLFKGLSPVQSYKDEGGYKYTYGSTTNYNEIIRIQRQVRTKFKDAFVVKFRNGERIK